MVNKPQISPTPENFSRWQTPQLDDIKRDQEEIDKEIEELKKQAYEEGLQLGKEEGLKQSLAEMQVKSDVVDSFIQSLSTPFNDINDEIKQELVNICGKVALALVRRELRTEPETIMAIVRDTVSVLNSSSNKINIHLHPEDANIIRDITNSKNDDQRWIIIDDPLISRGNCKVVSGDSLIDSDLKSRINLIITQILGDERNDHK